jgi:hypothetical protein
VTKAGLIRLCGGARLAIDVPDVALSWHLQFERVLGFRPLGFPERRKKSSEKQRLCINADEFTCAKPFASHAG